MLVQHDGIVTPDTEQARNLGKAARVILDEAEMVGLGYKTNVAGHETPPSRDPVPAAHSSTYPFPLS